MLPHAQRTASQGEYGGFGMMGGGGGLEKQMAALHSAHQARLAVNPRGTLSGTSSGTYFPGIPQIHENAGVAGPHARPNTGTPQNPALNTSLPEPSMNQPIRQQHARQQQFLQGLANIFSTRNAPLPPQLTGIQNPHYDPSNTPWSIIEPGSEVGTFKLAAKDVDLFQLWSHVFKNGGGRQLSLNGSWPSLLPLFDLPQEYPFPDGQISVATVLQDRYTMILQPFEDYFRKNMQENQRKANLANRQMMTNGAGPQSMPLQGMSNNGPQMRPNVPTPPGVVGPAGPVANGVRYPQMPQQQQQQQQQQPQTRPPSGPDPMLSASQTPDMNLLDQDAQGIKRKLEINDMEKRVRARTATLQDPPPGSPMSQPAMERHPSETPSHHSQRPQSTVGALPRSRQQPSRRKIEYVPLAHEIKTYGGRDLKAIEAEVIYASQRRPLRGLEEWGPIDIEAMTMSLRSRLANELSYSITTLTLLSTMKGQSPGSGFPIHQCPELVEEVLDFIEDIAFGESPDSVSLDNISPVVTNRQLVTSILDEQSLPFGGLVRRQGSKDPDVGPQPRPADYILAILNIFRNLSCIQDNVDFLAAHTRILDVILRICQVAVVDGVAKPASPVLSLNDLVAIRKDVLFTITSLTGFLRLSTSDHSLKRSLRITHRIFELTASYLVDLSEAVAPSLANQNVGSSMLSSRPPPLADVALEVFNRFGQPDHNRKLLLRAVSQPRLYALFESLTRRLPLSDSDYQLVNREQWLCYTEKLLLSIYTLAFMAPVDVKMKMIGDKRLRFQSTMARVLQRLLTSDSRHMLAVCARRATEVLKVLDDAKDPFENPTDSPAPTLSFGMGFADAADSGHEKGMGLLSGCRDIPWDILLHREVQSDDVMFEGLDSLIRVEFQ